MNCQSCKAEMPTGSKFCPKCGAATSANIACTHCGESSPPNSAFCVGCGKSLKPAVQTSMVSRDISSDFVYLLNEENMRAITSSSIRIPYGCFAVTLVNGVVHSIHDQVSTKSNEPSAVAGFFSSVSEMARALIGQRNNEVKTYVVTNCQNLPLISYVHSVQLPALRSASLRFDFWLEVAVGGVDLSGEALGFFLQHSMGGKSRIGTSEFRQVAIAGVQSILSSQPGLNFESQESLNAVMDLLKKTTGISGRCTLVEGKSVKRRYLEVSKAEKAVHCSKCNKAYAKRIRFCEICGTNMESADWGQASEVLQLASGEIILLKISLLSDKDRDDYTDEDISGKIVSAIGPMVRKLELNQVADASVLEALSLELNKTLGLSFNGVISELSVIDIRTASQEWFFRTEALIAEELRKIDAQQRGLAVDERALDLNEAAFALAMRSASQADSHRRKELLLRSETAEIEVDEQALDLRTELRKKSAALDAEERRHEQMIRADLKKEGVGHDADATRLERERDKFNREREFQRNVSTQDRVDEIERSQHQIKLEKTTSEHDIDLADSAGEAQSRAKRRDVLDASFEAEERARLQAKGRIQLGNIEEDLQDRRNQRQMDKLRAMSELEANMTKQDQDFQLSKVEGMKHLDAQQILAMQAAELVKAGGREAAAEIVKSIAQSQADAAGAGVKDELHRQILQTKDDAAKLALDAQKTAIDSLLKSNEGMSKLAGAASSSAVEGYKEAAKIAQTTNEKSMESMSKVATSAAVRKPTKEETENSPTTSIRECKSPGCDFTFDGRVKNFCPKCGVNQYE